jgi:ABC-type transport system involved in multi-copper enzyme maturation permease subunit
MMQVWALIVDGFRESRDRKIFWIMLGISAIVAAAMACISFGDNNIYILFGKWQLSSSDIGFGPTLDREQIVGIIVYWMMDFILGWVGIILALIATASFFPTMMDKGAIDVVLAKPITRAKLFLSKYLGSMVFVFVQAAFFVGLTFVVAGLRWKVWVPGYLWCILLMVVLFSYLYCVSVLTAVRTRSALAAVLVSMGAWVFFFGVQTAYDMFDLFPEWKENKIVYNVAQGARWVVPKTADITYFAGRWSGASAPADVTPQVQAQSDFEADITERAMDLDRERFEQSAFASMGSSLATEAVIVLIAMITFIRRDF